MLVNASLKVRPACFINADLVKQFTAIGDAGVGIEVTLQATIELEGLASGVCGVCGWLQCDWLKAIGSVGGCQESACSPCRFQVACMMPSGVGCSEQLFAKVNGAVIMSEDLTGTGVVVAGLPAADFTAFEVDGNSINLLDPAGDRAGLQINLRGDLTTAQVDHGVVAAFGKDVDQHLQCQWVV